MSEAPVEQLVIPNPIVEELPGWEAPPEVEIDATMPYEDIIEFTRDREYQMSPFEWRKWQAIHERILKKGEAPSEKAAETMAFDFWTRWKIETDLFYFGDQVLGWWKATDKSGKRYRVDPELHRWLCQLLDIEDDVLILIPRLHLKTTWVKLKIVQSILRNPNIRIGLFSVTDALVQHELKDIARILATPLLQRYFSATIPEPGKNYKNWERVTANELTVKRVFPQGVVPPEMATPQVFAAGLGTHIVGFHFDRAFMDDIIDDRVVASPAIMDKAVDWWQYITPILEIDSVTTMTGTPYHYADLYGKIRRERHFEKVFVRHGIEGGKPIYSTWFTLKDFKRFEKRLGPYKYACQMMCNAEPMELKPFPPPHPTYDALPQDEKGYTYYCMIDPAATTKAYSDKTAFTIVAMNHIRQAWVELSFGVKRKGDEIATALIRLHLMYHFNKVGIELGLQEHLQTIIELMCKDWERENRQRMDLPGRIVKVPIKKIKKGERIMDALGPLMRENRIRIKATNQELLNQMDHFTGQDGDEDDLIDSLSMLVYVAPSFVQHHGLPEQFRKAGWTIRELMTRSKRREGWEGRFKN